MTHSFGKSSIAIGSEYNEKRKKDYTTAKGVTKAPLQSKYEKTNHYKCFARSSLISVYRSYRLNTNFP
ncbi:hypothetical protein AT237_04565 [Bartonella henselae]|nr:hypothetical protein AT237_04565 [Bartonella henselae]